MDAHTASNEGILELMSTLDAGGLLASLPGRRGVVTRQVSAENPTGARGQGGRAVPDPGNPDLPHSRAAADLGVGFKVRPFLRLRAGETVQLADIAGPAVITHLFITSQVPDFRSLKLRITWDGATSPAVDVALADFFCLGGAGQGHTVVSVPIVVGPTRGCTSYWRMPFENRALVELSNEGDIDADVVAYKITYEERAHTGSARELLHFHAVTTAGRPDPVTSEFNLVNVSGSGLFVGCALNWMAIAPRWWGEGEVKMYLGKDAYPTLVDTGTEDYFGGAWGFGRDSGFLPTGPAGEQTFCGPYQGVPYMQTNEGYPREVVLYRWHLHDPVGFDDGLRVAVQALGQGPAGRYEIRDDTLRATPVWYAQ